MATMLTTQPKELPRFSRAAESSSAPARARGSIFALSNWHKGLLSIADQAIVSGTSFVTAVVVGRGLSAEDLGLYYLATSLVFILIGVQENTIAAPYTIYYSGQRRRERAEYSGSVWMHHAVLTAISAVLFLGAALVSFMLNIDTRMIPCLLTLALVAPAILLREGIRRFAFARLHLEVALAIDAIVAAAQVGCLLVLAYFGQLSIVSVFVAIGGACAVACLLCLVFSPRMAQFVPHRLVKDWRRNWSFARWAVLCYLVGNTTPYLMFWIVGLAVDSKATGILGGCLTLVGIINVFRVGAGNFLTPKAARAFAGNGVSGLRKLLSLTVIMFLLTLGPLCLAVMFSGDRLAVLVYGDEFRGYGLVLGALALGVISESVSMTAGTGLLALDRPRLNLRADLATLIVTLGAACGLVLWFGVSGAAFAILLGSGVGATVRTLSMLQSMKQLDTTTVDTGKALTVASVLGATLREFTVIRGCDLTPDHVAAWAEIQQHNSELDSPFLCPEFVQAVAAVRSDVEVAVMREGTETIAFFPFQRSRWNTGRPVGGPLSDFHGLIAAKDLQFDPLELLRACRLASWHFHHLIPQHAAIQPFTYTDAESPFIDLSAGFDAYAVGRKLPERRKKKNLTRDIGPLRFVADSDDRTLIATLLEWKSSQYRRTRAYNVFGCRWVQNLLYKLCEYRSDNFAPVLSALYAGNQLASVHLGLRSHGVLHQWFPTYNCELRRYSPGIVHLLEVMQTAQASGIRRIDLAKGPEPFKRRFMNGMRFVSEGAIDGRPTIVAARLAWKKALRVVHSSPIELPARRTACVLRSIRDRFYQD